MNLVPERCFNCKNVAEIFIRIGSLEILPAGQTPKVPAGIMCTCCKTVFKLSINEPTRQSQADKEKIAEELFKICFKTPFFEKGDKR